MLSSKRDQALRRWSRFLFLMQYVLASASPRRQHLIRLLGLPFELLPADVDEEQISHPDPAINVVQTAWLKLQAVTALVTEPAIIVAADTTVSIDGQMLNKPVSADEAWRMLRQLRGRTHQVHTGLALLNTATGSSVEDLATIDVPLRAYSDSEIDAYIATGDPLDKAGGYAIQHARFQPVASMTGCYAGVVGLPLCHLARSLRALRVHLPIPIAAKCQTHFDYHCPIHEIVLSGTPISQPKN